MSVLGMSAPPRSLRSLRVLPGLVLGVCLFAFLSPRPLSLHAQIPSPTEIKGALGVLARGSSSLTPGTEAALRIFAHESQSEQHSAPLSGVSVQISLSGNGKTQQLAEGSTDAAGSLDAHFVVPSWSAGTYTLRIRSQIAGQQHVEEQRVNLAPAARILVQSDKPLYQPGQVLHLRSLTMRAQDGRPLQSGTTRFAVKDPRGNIIHRSERAISAFGISSVDVPLADELLLGSYTVQAELVTEKDTPPAPPSSLSVEVSRYVLPKLRIDLTTEQSHVAPGDALRLSVSGQYVQGKPVRDGSVTITASLQQVGGPQLRELPTLVGKLSEQGQLSLRLPIPASIDSGDHQLVLHAKLEDEAAQRAEFHKEILVTSTALTLDLAAESGELIADVPNRVHVLAVRPDGTPVPDLAIAVQFGDAPVQRVVTSAIGLGNAEYTPRRSAERTRNDSCGYDELSVSARVTQPGQSPIVEKRCMKVRTEGGLLLRTDKAIYARGESLALSVTAPDVESGYCLVDVIRGEQLQDTLVVPISKGHGSATVIPRERSSGTLSLLAYVVRENGKQLRHDRLVYVEPPSSLQISAKAELVGEAALRPLRPGDATRLRFQVVDSQTGVGVPAALGVVMIDEALLALRPLRPGLLRAYFTLGAAAKTASERRKFSPNKLTLDALVERGSVSALEQQAAQFLLSGAVAPWNASWMTDPWEARKKAQAAIDKRWSGAVHRFAQLHPDQMGERVAGQRGAWRYRSGLPELMKQAGLLSDAERLDAWRRPVQTDRLVLVSHLPPFEEHADSLLDLKLTAVYRALNKLLLDDVDAKNRPRASDGSVIISEEDLARLGNISLVDPWGTALRIQVRKGAHSVGRLRSKSVIYSAGPDGVFGSADDRFPSSNLCYRHSCPSQHHGVEVVGVSASNAFAKAQIGCGCAYGSAYGAALMGSGHRMSRTLSIGSVTESLAAKKDSVRSHFPETLLFRPQLLTDEKGQASLDVTMADSITTWRLFADAVAQDGRLGSLMMGIAVQQDFFVDVDVPAVITQHDELAIPVPIFNHLNVPQKVTLTLMQAPWFDAQGPLHETIELAPSQSTVRYFRIKAQHVGRNVLRVSARGSVLSDAVERRVEVLPDGTEHVESTQQRLMGQPVSWNVSVPAMVIPGTRELTLKLYPSSATHVMEGLDALLRMPYGCFEQTSSTTYPNALILQYLRKTQLSSPEIERKAQAFLGTGYQRLLSYEVQGGGFSWFGNAPAHKILTAYGLEEFADMAEVFPVDPQVIERTQKWLVSQQKSDGSFDPDQSGIREGAINAMADDTLRTTAYLALSIRRTDPKGTHKQAVDRAKDYVFQSLRTQVSQDPYTLALVTELLGDVSVAQTAVKDPNRAPQKEAQKTSLIGLLWTQAKQDTGSEGLYFAPSSTTPTYGAGKSALVETTAVVASALQHVRPDKVTAPLQYLRASKDTFGTWHSTQATIRALKALIAQRALEKPTEGIVKVMLGGVLHQSIPIHAKQEALQMVTLPASSVGTQQVTLQFVGQGAPDFQLVSRYYVPRTAEDRAPQPAAALSQAVQLRTSLSTAVVGREQSVIQTAHLSSQTSFMMPLLQLGIPPGCTVEREPLDRMVKTGQIERYEISVRYVTLYLRKLSAQQELQLPVTLTAHVPGRMQVPAALLYPYYQPELTANAPPMMITVNP